MEKLSVESFVTKYSKCSSENLKAKMLGEVVSRKYAPYLEKVLISRSIIEKSLATKDGVYQKNSTSLYLNYIMGMLILYCPTLELNPDNNFANYDLLKQNGLIELIIQHIGEDVEEYLTVYQMETNDMLDNQLSAHAFISSQVTRFATILGSICDGGLKSVMTALDGADEDTIKQLTNILKSISK